MMEINGHKFDVVNEKGHFLAYENGEFVQSADTESELEEDLYEEYG